MFIKYIIHQLQGFGVVYVFVAPAFRQRWPVRLNLIDTNGRGGRRNQLRMSFGSVSTGGLGDPPLGLPTPPLAHPGRRWGSHQGICRQVGPTVLPEGLEGRSLSSDDAVPATERGPSLRGRVSSAVRVCWVLTGEPDRPP